VKFKIVSVICLLSCISSDVISSFTNITFEQAAPFGNTVGPTSGSQASMKQDPDPNSTSMRLYITSAVDKQNKAYVLANPYNHNLGMAGVSDSVQPIADGLFSAFTTGANCQLYVVPFFVSEKTQEIISDLSTIGPDNKAHVWVALFDVNKNPIYSKNHNQNASAIVSQDAPGQWNDHIDFPIGQKWITAYHTSVPSYVTTTITNIGMQGHHGAFSITSTPSYLTKLMQNAKQNKYFGDMTSLINLGIALDPATEQQTHLSYPATYALRAILRGIVNKKLNKQASSTYNQSLAENWFISNTFFKDVGTMLSSGQKSGSLQDLTIRTINTNTWSDEADINYIKNHLASALTSIAQDITINTANSSTLNVNFPVKTYNSVIVKNIINNTKATFKVYQGSNHIGNVKPGANNLPLYGAAHAQGDIVFMPAGQSNVGTFRISFLKGSDLINKVSNANETPIDNVPGADDEFVCVEIKPGERSVIEPNGQGDFPKNSADSLQTMFKRIHCINTGQLTAPTFLDVKIEDSMTINLTKQELEGLQKSEKAAGGDVTSSSVITIDQSKAPLFFPSIKSIMSLTGQTIPFLFLPDSLQDKATLVNWIDFVNIVIGVLNSSYQELFTPKNIQNAIESIPSTNVLRKKGYMFGDVAKLKNSYVYGGLPGTHYMYTADIPTNAYFKSYPVQKQKFSFNASSGIWIGANINNKMYYFASASPTGINVTSISNVLSDISKVTAADWQAGIYFYFKEQDKQVFLYVYNSLGQKIISAPLPNLTSLPSQVVWQGSYMYGPNDNKIAMSTSKVFGLTTYKDTSLLKSSFNILTDSANVSNTVQPTTQNKSTKGAKTTESSQNKTVAKNNSNAKSNAPATPAKASQDQVETLRSTVADDNKQIADLKAEIAKLKGTAKSKS
tara:strand:+ start:864 stop:3572 length:2709 start_codon:yes stop_codon:yes gene_type:complete